MACRLRMGHHRYQVALQLGIGTLVPQPREVVAAFGKLRRSLFLAFVNHALRQSSGEIRPSRQLTAVFPRESKQRGEHLGCEFDRDAIYPIEGLVAREVVENLRRPLADKDCQLIEMRWREH